MNVKSVYVKIKNHVMTNSDDTIELTYEVDIAPGEKVEQVTKAVIKMGRAVIADAGGSNRGFKEEVWEESPPGMQKVAPSPFGTVASNL